MESQFITNFKGKLWSFCQGNHVFDNIPVEKYGEVKSVLDNSVENFKTQIMQNDSNYDFLFPKIISEMMPQISKLKNITRDAIHSEKNDLFNKQLDEKQKEFDLMMKKNQPKPIDFGDNSKDEPLSSSNLESLLEEQMKQRENLGLTPQPKALSPTSTDKIESIPETNTIIGNTTPILDINTVPQSNENHQEILNILKDIQRMQGLQLDVINKLVKSQINILQKLK